MKKAGLDYNGGTAQSHRIIFYVWGYSAQLLHFSVIKLLHKTAVFLFLFTGHFTPIQVVQSLGPTALQYFSRYSTIEAIRISFNGK